MAAPARPSRATGTAELRHMSRPARLPDLSLYNRLGSEPARGRFQRRPDGGPERHPMAAVSLARARTLGRIVWSVSGKNLGQRGNPRPWNRDSPDRTSNRLTVQWR